MTHSESEVEAEILVMRMRTLIRIKQQMEDDRARIEQYLDGECFDEQRGGWYVCGRLAEMIRNHFWREVEFMDNIVDIPLA